MKEGDFEWRGFDNQSLILLQKMILLPIHLNLNHVKSCVLAKAYLHLAGLRKNNRPKTERVRANRSQTQDLSRVMNNRASATQVVSCAPSGRGYQYSIALENSQKNIVDVNLIRAHSWRISFLNTNFIECLHLKNISFRLPTLLQRRFVASVRNDARD